MALIALYTVSSGPGYTAAQSHPSGSLGPFASTTAWPGGNLHDLFGRASSADAAASRASYACVYVYNDSYAETLAGVRVYLDAAPNLQVGLDPRPVTYIDSLAPQAVDIASGYTAPSGVGFSSPSDYATGLELGELPPQTGRAFWLKRTPDATGFIDSGEVVVEASGGSPVITRRVSWEVEAGLELTRPEAPAVFTPTPSPFRRVSVDYLTAGGARVTWEADRTLTDAGPYVYQLYASQSGVADASDWVAVGDPAQDATHLLDPSQRLWGASPTLHYRVVLTTASGSYTSPVAGVTGQLTVEQWLQVREVLRKEALRLQRFVGVDGFLLKAKRYGQVCTCVDPYSGEIGNSSDLTCYGLGIVGGYHPPVPFTFYDTSNASSREKVYYNENRGTVNPLSRVVRMLATLPVAARDAVVLKGSDERYYVDEVRELVTRVRVPVVYAVTIRLAPRSDVLYSVPVSRPEIDPPGWKTTTTVSV